MSGRARRRFGAGAVAAAALASVLTTGGRGGAAAVHETAVERTFAAAINDVRVRHGLPRLAADAALVVSARGHSGAMLATGRFEHGTNWWKRLEGAGASGRLLGENIGWCASRACSGGSPGYLIRRWLASPSHRANLLDGTFDRLGVGVAVGPFHGWKTAYVVTTDFAG